MFPNQTKCLPLLISIFSIIIFTNSLQAEQQNIKIPVLIPLTGNASEQAAWVKDGLELARQQISQNLNLNIELLYQDTQLDPKTALSAYQHVKSFNSFPAIITMGSGVAMALTPISNQDKIIQMGVATEVIGYSSSGDYTFRNYPGASEVAKFAGKLISKHFAANRIAMIKINNDYGLSAAEELKKRLKKTDLLIMEEPIQPGGSDFRSQLIKVKKANPDLIYLAVYPNEGALLLKQAKQLAIKTKFLSTATILGSKDFMNLAGGGAEGISIISMTPLVMNNSNPATQKFIKDYEFYYKKNPSIESFLSLKAYDALMILANGAKNCVTDATCLRDYLFTVNNYPGAGGSITFDLNGDVQTDFYTLTVKDSTYQLSNIEN